MNPDLIFGAVGYWYGFSVLAAMHFFVRRFEKLQPTLALRLWRLALSVLLLFGVFSFAFFSGYAIRAVPNTDAHFKGLFLGFVMYATFAWLWRRYVERLPNPTIERDARKNSARRSL